MFKRTLNTIMFWGHGSGQDYNALQGLEAVVRADAKAHSLVKKTDREEILAFMSVEFQPAVSFVTNQLLG